MLTFLRFRGRVDILQQDVFREVREEFGVP